MSVYVGIDVRRKRSQVAVIDQDGKVLANRNVNNGVKLETSDAVKLSSCSVKFFRSGGEGDRFVVLAAGGQAVP